jgi:hypothetical protein
MTIGVGDSIIGIGGASSASISIGDGQTVLVTASNLATLQAMVNAGQARLLATAAEAIATKYYSAKITQAAAAAPVATVLKNSLGGTVVWTRSAKGIYVGTLAGAFTVAKTIVFTTDIFSVASVSVAANAITVTCDDDSVLSGHSLVVEVAS